MPAGKTFVVVGSEVDARAERLAGEEGAELVLRVFLPLVDPQTKVWDVEEKKRVKVLHGHEATVCSVVADEHKIVSGAADKVPGKLSLRELNE